MFYFVYIILELPIISNHDGEVTIVNKLQLIMIHRSIYT